MVAKLFQHCQNFSHEDAGYNLLATVAETQIKQQQDAHSNLLHVLTQQFDNLCANNLLHERYTNNVCGFKDLEQLSAQSV